MGLSKSYNREAGNMAIQLVMMNVDSNSPKYLAIKPAIICDTSDLGEEL